MASYASRTNSLLRCTPKSHLHFENSVTQLRMFRCLKAPEDLPAQTRVRIVSERTSAVRLRILVVEQLGDRRVANRVLPLASAVTEVDLDNFTLSQLETSQFGSSM